MTLVNLLGDAYAVSDTSSPSFTGQVSLLGSGSSTGLLFGATAQAKIYVSADTTSGVLTFVAPSAAGQVTIIGKSGSQATPGRLTLDDSYANSATPGVSQLKLSLLSGSSHSSDGYGLALSSAGGVWVVANNGGGGGAFGVQLAGNTLLSMVGGNEDVAIGRQSALATNATSGFVYIRGGAGTPTGVPSTTYTGLSPLYVDQTNHKLYFYSGGAWRDAGP